MKKTSILLLILFGLSSFGLGLWAYWHYSQDKKQEAQLLLASQVLEGVYNQSRIQTSEAFYQFLFPFDFLPWSGSAWSSLKAQALNRKPLPPNDWETLELVRLARKIGFDPELGKYGFLVLNIQVRAGLNLEAFPMETRVEVGPQGRILILDLPTPEVSDFVVTETPESNKFPSPTMAPLDWKLLVEGLKPRILSKIITDGLLDQGKESAEKIFDKIMRSTGLREYEINWITLAQRAQMDEVK